MTTTEQGIYCWYYDQIRARHEDGVVLVATARERGITWLHAELTRRGDGELVAAYRERHRAKVRDRYWADKMDRLIALEMRLAQQEVQLPESEHDRLQPLRKAIEKLHKSLAKHATRQQEVQPAVRRRRKRNGLHSRLYALNLERHPDDGEALIEAARAHGIGNKRITWLLRQLEQRGDTRLVAAYRRKCNTAAKALYWNKKRAALAQLEERIRQSNVGSAQRQQDKRRVEKLRRSIAKHEEQAHARKH